MRVGIVRMLAVAACLGGCDADVPDAPDLIDTGWFDDGGVDGLCGEVIAATTPAAGATGWYWHDPLTVTVDAPSDVYAFRLTDEGGGENPVAVTVDGTGLNLTLRPAEPLRPSTTYRLQATDCRGTRELAFTTSSLGAPLIGGPASLRGRTWQIDPVHATWVSPPGLGQTLASVLLPILFGTAYVDDVHLDLLGAIGEERGGDVFQDDDVPSWDFPLGDFGDAPFFEASTDRVELIIQSWALPIEDLYVSGTFAPDGSSIGGMILQGLGDTRDAGGAVGAPDDADALCTFAAAVGVDCVPCADGEVYCLEVDLRGMQARELEDVTLRPVVIAE